MFVPEKTSHCATFAGATRRGGEAAKICFNQGNSGALCPMGSVSIPAHTGGALCPTGSVSIPAHTGGALCPAGSVSIPAPHWGRPVPRGVCQHPCPTWGRPVPRGVCQHPWPHTWDASRTLAPTDGGQTAHPPQVEGALAPTENH